MTYKSFTLVTRHSNICQPYSSIVYIQTLELIHDSSKRWHSTWQWSEESENYLAYRKVLWLTHITSYTHNFYDLSVSFLLLTKQSQRVTIIFIKSVHTHTHTHTSKWLSLTFHEISYLGLFIKSVDTFQIWLKLHKTTDTLHKELSMFVITKTQSRCLQMLNTQ